MSTSKEKVRFAAKRFTGFLKIFMRNTKGIVGMLILLMFGAMVVYAPIGAPYDYLRPQSVSGILAAPLWVKYLPPILGGRSDLSENHEVVNDPGFSNPPAINSDMIGEWSYKKSPNITIQYEPTIGTPTPGCLKITLERDIIGKLYGKHSVYIYKDYYFPYPGPPYQFFGEIDFSLNGTTYTDEFGFSYYDVPTSIGVFFEQLDTGQKWKIFPLGSWSGTVNTPFVSWAQGLLTSDSIELYVQFGYSSPIKQMYARTPGRYRLGVEVTFQDKKNPNKPVYSTLYIDNFYLNTRGTSWGILGTTDYGYDLWAQLANGAGLSLYVGVVSAILAVVIGLIVGLAAGYLGGIVDEILMRFNDMLLVLPTLPLLMVLMSVLGAKLENLIIVLGLLGWNGFARVVRSQVLSLKERSFIEAAKAAGAGSVHIMSRHIMPNVMSLIYVTLATSVPGNIMAEAALSFLGFSDPLRISWGKMLEQAQGTGAAGGFIWWWVIPPGLCLALLALSFVLLGYALDDVLNPKLRMRR